MILEPRRGSTVNYVASCSLEATSGRRPPQVLQNSGAGRPSERKCKAVSGPRALRESRPTMGLLGETQGASTRIRARAKLGCAAAHDVRHRGEGMPPRAKSTVIVRLPALCRPSVTKRKLR